MYTLHHHYVTLVVVRLLLHLTRHVVLLVELDKKWQACVHAFLRSFSRSNSEASAKYYRSQLGVFFRTCRRSTPEHITRADVEDFMWMDIAQGRRNAGNRPSPGTRNVRLAVVASFFKYASDYVPEGEYKPLFEGRLPTTGIRQAKQDINYRGLSLADLERFFSVIDRSTLIGKRDYAIFITLYLSARRLREIVDLTYGDIMLEVIKNGTERRQAWVYHFRGKGYKGKDDSAELSNVAKAAIDDYLEASGRLPLAPDDPLFVSAPERVGYDPYKSLSSGTVGRRFKLYCGYAGLSRRLSPHSLRHASSQHRLEQGASIMEINRVLRHTSLDVTKRYAQGLMSEADPGLKDLERPFKE